jgi:hypothetical protein
MHSPPDFKSLQPQSKASSTKAVVTRSEVSQFSCSLLNKSFNAASSALTNLLQAKDLVNSDDAQRKKVEPEIMAAKV